MKIHNWDKWQSYRKDRGAPPWIKVYRNVFSNIDWCLLTDAEKGQLVSMWVLASDRSGEIPDDPKFIKKMCMLDTEPNLSKFKELGLIESNGCHVDVTLTPERRQDDAPETETETETEDLTPIGVVKPKVSPKTIIELWNTEMEGTYATQKLMPTDALKRSISARCRNEFTDLDLWKQYFSDIKSSPFLMGKVQNGDRRPFKVSLEWAVKPGNIAKVGEGHYHDVQQQS